MILCGACLGVVLESSDKAWGIYKEIVESYRLPDIREALNRLAHEAEPGKAVGMLQQNIEELKVRQSDNLDKTKPLVADGGLLKGLNDRVSEYSDVFAKSFDMESGDILSVDFRYWLGLIEELIRVGFNRESEQARGIYKVKLADSPLLALAIQIRSFAEYNRLELVMDDKTKAVRVSGRTYDLSRFLADVATSRAYRDQRKAYRQAGYIPLQDETIGRNAWWWYESRVEYSGPEEFTMKMWRRDLDEDLLTKKLDPSNVSREIRAYDEAIGCPRGK